jgi:creatinine amidohydrolase
VPLFAELTYEELRDIDRDRVVVVVPTGCTWQQGPHLAVDFDTWFPSELLSAVAAQLDAQGTPTLVMPAMPVGPTPEHRVYGSGYVNLRQSTFEAVVT